MDNEKEVQPQAEQEAPAQNAAPQTQQKAPRPQAPRGRRKKVCIFCADKIDHIDYKDQGRLRKCTSERSKILPRRMTGTCAKHQRQLTVAVKRARTMALLPYVSD